jgi:hypothetical protein
MGANSSPGYKIVLSLTDLKLLANGNLVPRAIVEWLWVRDCTKSVAKPAVMQVMQCMTKNFPKNV